MLRALAFVLILVPTAGALAADPPTDSQKHQPAVPVSVSHDKMVPFKNTSGLLPFDTGDYLLSDVQGLARSRGFFTMEYPPTAAPLNTNPGHCFRQFGLRRR